MRLFSIVIKMNIIKIFFQLFFKNSYVILTVSVAAPSQEGQAIRRETHS